jgi:hypothetical protein
VGLVTEIKDGARKRKQKMYSALVFKVLVQQLPAQIRHYIRKSKLTFASYSSFLSSNTITRLWSPSLLALFFNSFVAKNQKCAQ